MTAEVDNETGMITTYVGDTILFNVDNVPTDLDYIVYFEVRDIKTDAQIIDPIPFIPIGSSVQIEVKPYITDIINIPEGKKYIDCRYALKACNTMNEVEHTLTIAENVIGTENKIRFFRKQAEGTI